MTGPRAFVGHRVYGHKAPKAAPLHTVSHQQQWCYECGAIHDYHGPAARKARPEPPPEPEPDHPDDPSLRRCMRDGCSTPLKPEFQPGGALNRQAYCSDICRKHAKNERRWKG